MMPKLVGVLFSGSDCQLKVTGGYELRSYPCRDNEGFFRNAAILLIVSQCYNCVMSCGMFVVTNVVSGCCDVIV